MGSRGSKAKAAGTRAAASFTATVEPLGGIEAKAMFGGHGIFRDDVMFAIIDSEGHLYLRADATTSGAFEAAGSTQHARMPYWELPDDIRDQPDELLSWARTASEVAARGKR
jgi:DNA transformation protein